MPEVKANVRSPKIVKYGKAHLIRVDFDVYVYSGTKNTDKGTSVLSFSQYPQGSDEFVTVDWGEIANEFIKPNITAPLNDNVDYVKWLQIDYTLVAPDTSKTFWHSFSGVSSTIYRQTSVECAKKFHVDNFGGSRSGVVFQFGNGETLKIGSRVYFQFKPFEEYSGFTQFIGGYYYTYSLVNDPVLNSLGETNVGYLVKIDLVDSGEVQITDIQSLSQVDATLCSATI